MLFVAWAYEWQVYGNRNGRPYVWRKRPDIWLMATPRVSPRSQDISQHESFLNIILPRRSLNQMQVRPLSSLATVTGVRTTTVWILVHGRVVHSTVNVQTLDAPITHVTLWCPLN